MRSIHPPRGRVARVALLLLTAAALVRPAGAVTIDDGVATVLVSDLNGEMRAYVSGGVDHLFESLYFYRTDAMTQESVLVGPGQASVASVTQTGATEITVLGSTATFDYTLIYALNGNGGLAPSLMLTNTSGADLDITLFSYQDWDVAGSPDGDLISWDGSAMVQSEGGTAISVMPFQTPDAVQVAPFRVLADSLEDAVITSLDGSGLPFGPGDGTYAFQFDLSLPAGGSTRIGFAVPEPSSGALTLVGLLGLARLRRRQRRATARGETR